MAATSDFDSCLSSVESEEGLGLFLSRGLGLPSFLEVCGFFGFESLDSVDVLLSSLEVSPFSCLGLIGFCFCMTSTFFSGCTVLTFTGLSSFARLLLFFRGSFFFSGLFSSKGISLLSLGGGLTFFFPSSR